MAHLELYELETCPSCQAVRETLEELEVAFESHVVPRSHGKRRELLAVSEQTCVPVLVDADHGVEGLTTRTAIIEHLESTYE